MSAAPLAAAPRPVPPAFPGPGPGALTRRDLHPIGSSGPDGPTALQARYAAVAAMIFLAPLALQWQWIVSSAAFGVVRWFHVGAVLMVLVHLWRTPRFVGGLRGIGVLVTAMGVLTALSAAAAVVYGDAWAQPIQHAVYFVIGLYVAIVLETALARPEGRRILVWVAPIAVTWFLVETTGNLMLRGVDVVGTLRSAVGTGRPNVIIFGIFQPALSDGALLNPANIRHEVMGALLVVLAVSALCGRVSRAPTLAVATAAVVVGVVVVLAMSRSVLLAVVATGLAGATGGLNALRRLDPARQRRWVLAVGGGAAVGIVVAGPVAWRLFYSRIVADTSSYDSRLDTLSMPAPELAQRALSGGPDLLISTHMLVVDSFIRAGWLAALAALAVVGVVVVAGYRALRCYLATSALRELLAFGAATLFIVRSFTMGMGYLHQVEWVAVGVVLAVARARSRGPLAWT